jgi:hypothetical protein
MAGGDWRKAVSCAQQFGRQGVAKESMADLQESEKYFRTDSGLAITAAALHYSGFHILQSSHSCKFGWRSTVTIKAIQLPALGGPAVASGPAA